MLHARSQHPNAPLTPEGRRRMVECVLVAGWTIEATAERFQVDAKTVRKWRDRFVAEGNEGLLDRSSRPHRSPNETSRSRRARVLRSASETSLGRRSDRVRGRNRVVDRAADLARRGVWSSRSRRPRH